MAIVNIHEATTYVSKLVPRAEAGEEIVIGRVGDPVVALSRWAAVRREAAGGSGPS